MVKYHLRRKEKEITDSGLVLDILKKGQFATLALCRNDEPYVVTMNYGFDSHKHALYFHCAREGKKLDVLKRNDRVCVEFDLDQKPVTSESPCEWTMPYQSVIGFGRASLVDDPDSKQKALDAILKHYGATGPFSYHEKDLARALIIQVTIERMTGKRLEP